MERSKAIAVLRSGEQRALLEAPQKRPDQHRVITDCLVSRNLFAAIERPPSRHREFLIRTVWNQAEDGHFTPLEFKVFVHAAHYPWALRETAIGGHGRFDERGQ